MNVLSAFDGISCGRLALERANINITNYYASEIDKYAINIALKNYPDTIEIGNISDINLDMLPRIDLMIGGSPCQGFSFAGRQLLFDDPRSALFFEYVKIKNALQERNPDLKFLLENVKMKKECVAVITDQLGVEPVEINSALVSAQNRKRLYWTNIPFTVPTDREILLKDVLLNEVDKAVGASARGRHIVDGKRVDYKGAPTTQRIEVNGLEKSNCLSTVQKDSYVVECYVEPMAVSNIYGGFNESTPRIHTDKSPTIRANSGGGSIPSTIDLSKLYLSDKAIDYMCRHRKGKPRWEYHTNPLDGKAACLTANMFKGVPYGVIKELLRKLHPIECERLQTLPDNWTEGVSNSQRYKMIGNAWTVDVIAEIFKGLQ